MDVTHMKHTKRVLLLVAAVLLLAVFAFVAYILIWQWDNLQVLGAALTQPKETIVREMEQQHAEEASFMKEQEISVQIPTIEQDKGLMEGTVSPQELKEALGLRVSENAPSESTSEAILEACVRQLYSYRVDLFAQLGELERRWKTAWYALPVEDQDKAHRNDFFLDALDECYDMEVDADNRVLSLLDDCRAKLSGIGADPKLADQLWDSYCDDKRAAKTYYLKEYID